MKIIKKIFSIGLLLFVFSFLGIQTLRNSPMVLAENPSILIPFGQNVDGVKHLPKIGLEDVKRGGETFTQGEGIEGFRKIINIGLSATGLLLKAVAIFVLFLAGFTLVTAQNSASEQVEQQKMNVLYTLVGLIVFGLAAEFVYEYLFVDEGSYILAATDPSGEAAKNVAVALGNRIKELLQLFLSFSGAGAILMLVISGMRLLTSPGNEEEMGRQKKVVAYTAIGIVIIGLAETVIDQIIFPDAGYQGINVSALEVQLSGISNYLLGFLGVIVFATFVLSGVVIVSNLGNEELVTKAKSAMKNVVIGSLIVFSAYTIVATVVGTFLAS